MSSRLPPTSLPGCPSRPTPQPPTASLSSPIPIPRVSRHVSTAPSWRHPDKARMTVIGLTGGIGMGKSTCAQLLGSRGIPIVDTDDLARQVVEPGQPALVEVRAAFGPEVIGPDGRLRRDTLA